ncbi:MAG: SDR family oxidoreductase [SAR324 cluster bacterium]|nr:SDR family oxidoreductase [SAR324 cluster bacterium]MCH8885659.1 SDR family oxidoreductase [SAR324 cluster bacterium]
MENNPFDLTGKNAIVTGASKGIGRSIAEHLARFGARVVISSRKLDACEEVAGSIREQGGEAVAISCNVSRKEEVEKLVPQAREAFGPIDIMVCNAAVNPYYGPLPEITDEAYHKIMDSNVLSALWFARLVKDGMAARGGGAFIVVSSIGSLKGSAVLGAYGISKAADNQLVRSLAVEWGRHNIRVNALLPGLVKTDMARVLWESPEAQQRIKERFPIPRAGDPDDLGPAAVFLASRAGAWMTGQTLVIDGGSTIMGG